MRIEKRPVPGATPGLTFEVSFLHFGNEGQRPRIYIQAGLHADEGPSQLTAHHLRARLEALEAKGLIRGHIVLVPCANPIGLAQSVLGTLHGRFALADGVNFNRDFPELVPEVAVALEGRLTDDGEQNAALIRAALRDGVSRWKPVRQSGHLKRLLLSEAIDADTVLDLHCDSEAEVHLYVHAGQVEAFLPLARYLKAKAVLLADVSGNNPFDEAVSRPWHELRRHFPDRPVPQGAIATTVELRGESDVNHDMAAADAGAILEFLACRGVLALTPAPMPAPECQPTPLAASEALEAPAAGLVVFACPIGQHVRAGDLIAEIIDPVSGDVACVRATTAGLFYARASVRFAVAGRRLGKIAGTTPFRNGNLLSP